VDVLCELDRRASMDFRSRDTLGQANKQTEALMDRRLQTRACNRLAERLAQQPDRLSRFLRLLGHENERLGTLCACLRCAQEILCQHPAPFDIAGCELRACRRKRAAIAVVTSP